MARRIILRENGLTGSNPPVGYKFLGFYGLTFSYLESNGVVNSIGGTGSGNVGYGNDGSNSNRWLLTNTTGGSNPGVNNFATDNTDPLSLTGIWIHRFDSYSIDQKPWLDEFQLRLSTYSQYGYLQIKELGSNNVIATYNPTYYNFFMPAFPNPGNYAYIALTPISGGGTFTVGQEYSISWVFNGSNATITADNGVTELSPGVFGLGGSLSQATIIDAQGNNFTFGDLGKVTFTASAFISNQVSGLGKFTKSILQYNLFDLIASDGIKTSTISLNADDQTILDGSTDNRLIINDGNNKGLVYFDDYSANFTTYSLVTKGYVDSVSSGTSGTSGTSGFSGTSGSSGTSGQQGAPGETLSALGVELNYSSMTQSHGTSYSVVPPNVLDAYIVQDTSSFWIYDPSSTAANSEGWVDMGQIQGPQGLPGTSGIDGTSGTSGIDGTSGTSGIDGTSGTAGTSGTSIFTSVDNGLELVSDTLYLGGTLSQNTTINSENLNFTIQNFDNLTLTGSTVDISLDNGQFVLDSSNVDIYSENLLILSTGDIDLSTTDEFSLTVGSGSITTSDSKGLVYTSDYSATFVTHSLVTKKYVDDSITTGTSGTSGVNGTSGTSGTSGIDGTSGTAGTSGTSIFTSVDNGLELVSDTLYLGGTLSQNTTINSENLNFTIQNFDSLTLTGSTVDINLNNGQFVLDSSNVDIYSENLLILSTGDIDLSTTDEFSLSVGSGSITTSDSKGLVYTSDYSATFVTHSLVTKKYVDDEIDTLAIVDGLSIILDIDNKIKISPTAAGSGLTFSNGIFDINVDTTGLTISGDLVSLQNTISGDRVFQDSVTIGGNLIVNGTTSYIYTENLVVEDNLITLNATWSGSPILNAGIEVNRGTEDFASLIWNESTDLWSAGLSGSEVSILLNAGTGLSKNGSTVSVNINNGLEIVSNNISLGGTLSQNTTIDSDGFNLTIGNALEMSLTASDFINLNVPESGSSVNQNVIEISSSSNTISSGFKFATWSYVQTESGAIYVSSQNGSAVKSQINITNTPQFIGGGDGSIDNFMLIDDGIGTKGLVYTNDYTANFTTYSLVTKGYVDSQVTSVGATNGLSEISSGVVGLGGTLSQNTIISGDTYNLSLLGFSRITITSSQYISETVFGSSNNTNQYNNGDFYRVQSGDAFATMSQLLVDDSAIDLSSFNSLGSSGINISNIDQLVNDGSFDNRLVITDINQKGLIYVDDYSANFTTYSLVTKGYVDSQVGSVGATNGLSEISSGVVGLGGTLSQNTTVNASNYGLYFQGNNEIDHFVNDLNSFPDIYGQVNLTSQIYDAKIGSLSGNTFSRVAIQNQSVLLECQDDLSNQVAIQVVSTQLSSGDGSIDNRLLVIDDLSNKGIVYAGDYSANFTTYSLVTKGYVDSQVTSVGATNGLSEISSGVVGLGGTLSQNTTINAGGFNFTFGNFNNLFFTASNYAKIQLYDGNDLLTIGVDGASSYLRADIGLSMSILQVYKGTNTVNDGSINNTLVVLDQISQKGLVYNDDYSANFTTYSLVTKGYVDSVSSGSISAANGLELISNTLYLGGTLSQNTQINSNGYDFTIGNFDYLTLTGSIVNFNVENGLYISNNSSNTAKYGSNIQLNGTQSLFNYGQYINVELGANSGYASYMTVYGPSITAYTAFYLGIQNGTGNSSWNNHGFKMEMLGQGSYNTGLKSITKNGSFSNISVWGIAGSQEVYAAGDIAVYGLVSEDASLTSFDSHSGYFVNRSKSVSTNYGIEIQNTSTYSTSNIGLWISNDGAVTNNNAIVVDTGSSIFNESGGDYDFRIEGDTDQNLFFVDASTDNIGVGNNAPSYKLQVTGTVSTTGFRMTDGASNGYVMVSNAVGVSSWTASYRTAMFSHGSLSPADGTTYYIGDIGDLAPPTSDQVSRRIKSQFRGEVVSVSITCAIGGVNGSSESVTYQITNVTTATTQTITSSAQMTGDFLTTYTLGTPLVVSEGDDIQIRMVCPTWVTNPTTVRQRFVAKIRIY